MGLGLMFAAMAIATAPATVVAIVAESKARGMFVRTLIAGVALNNMACIVLFEIARSVAHVRLGTEASVVDLVKGPAVSLFVPMVIGLAVGGTAVLVTRRIARSDLLASASVIAILFTAGLADVIGISGLLACLFLGVAFANFTPDKDEIGHRVFHDFENAIFAVFFTLAGVELDFAFLRDAGLFAVAFVVARVVGKLLAARVAMTIAGAPETTRNYLGLALLPQAGVAIGLVFVVQSDPVLSDVSQLFLAVGITAVAANEVIGPITTRLAVQKSGEAGLDTTGVIDFLQPRHILTDLGAVSMEVAVQRLIDRLNETHDIDFDMDAFRASVAKDVADGTYLGHGLAIPHARVETKGDAIGVMGSREGLEEKMADDELVHCVVLLATPEGRADRHLEVMAAFVKAIGSDRSVERSLYHARDPAHAFELLHAVEEPDLNVILEKLDT